MGSCLRVTILILVDGFLQSLKTTEIANEVDCHNPYFSRWFSAIGVNTVERKNVNTSQSLF